MLGRLWWSGWGVGAVREGCCVGGLGSSSAWAPWRPELLPCKERLAAGLYLPIAIPPHPAAAVASVLRCVLAYGSLYFCFHTCLVLHSSTSPCSCPGLPAPPPSIACAVSLSLAALLSWCRGLLSILLAGRMSFHACQAALLLFKDADSGSRIPIGQSWESVWLTKQGNKPVRVISIWSIF